MDEHFEQLHEHLKLTSSQRDEVKRKHSGVSKSLYEEFYDGDYDPKTRLIIGSHGKKTESRHPIGDIDLIFKISKADLDRYQAYESNGPSALLQRVREKLQQTYTVTEIKSWGKVVLVEFGDGQHDVEVLPCYEEAEGTFTIPNSENGGYWEPFDPRAEMRMISESQGQTGITRKLIKFVKRWRTKSNAQIKSFQIEYFCVSYLEASYDPDMTWSELVEGFFTWLELQADDLSDDGLSKTVSAKGRAQKARDYELSEKYDDACEEWRKVFGRVFPIYDSNLSAVKALEQRYPVEGERFIHDTFPVKIDSRITIEIVPKVKRKGFRDFQQFSHFFVNGVRHLPKEANLEFVVKSSIGKLANYYWKVRNLSEEAQRADDLRGEITKDKGGHLRKEDTKYNGTHYIECYAIVSGVCVAIARRFVPIQDDSV